MSGHCMHIDECEECSREGDEATVHYFQVRAEARRLEHVRAVLTEFDQDHPEEATEADMVRRILVERASLRERIGGLPCAAPDYCSGPEFADVSTNCCSTCLFMAEVLA